MSTKKLKQIFEKNVSEQIEKNVCEFERTCYYLNENVIIR